MRIYRLIVDLAMLTAGAGAGIYWGVHHPQQAADIAQREHEQALNVEIAATKAKIEMLQKFGGGSPTAQQMLGDQQKKLDEENQALTTQPSQ